MTDTGLVCLAVPQGLLRFHDERQWLRAARSRVGQLFLRLLDQSEYNEPLTADAAHSSSSGRHLAVQHVEAEARLPGRAGEPGSVVTQLRVLGPFCRTVQP